MRPDLTTLDGQRTATRRMVYVVLPCLALGVFVAATADYPEVRLNGMAVICFTGGGLMLPLTTLREMSRRQRWIDVGSPGSPPRQSKFWNRFGIAAGLLGYLCACILTVLSGALYPHWHHVYRGGPWYAITIGSLGIVSLGWMLPAIYKAQFRKG